ncbi:MAG: 3-hydroxybutyrate dehydrogenase [Burkholderiales bacterium]|nr:3-hydroxybutyrate dehydrogenase [Burkholderiales bacterium]
MSNTALASRVALVTGSTSGIGLAIARRLAAAGAEVVLNGFGDPADIERLRDEIAEAAGVRVHYVPADLAKPAEARALVEQALAICGRLDVLINNAGIQHVAPVAEFPDERWEAVLAINLSAAFYTTKAALPDMQKRGWGRIINIASAHGKVASIHKAAYVAAKHGVIGLTKVVALETAKTQITCNAICPGWVDTPLVRKQILSRAEAQGITVEEATRALVGEKQPSERFVQPEHIAELALFLTSEAGGSITGAAYSIDGGWTAQ